MYDFSGEWLVRVGLPAKSGVSGGLAAVSPSQFGIGMYSPPLDERGNSIRGVEACTAMSERFSLHLMHQVKRSAPSLIPVAETGRDVAVLKMQGYLEFAAAEQALLAVQARDSEPSRPAALIVDLDHVTRCHPVAAALLDRIIDEISDWGVRVVTVDKGGRRLLNASAEFASIPDALTDLSA
jgi:glutaminase